MDGFSPRTSGGTVGLLTPGSQTWGPFVPYPSPKREARVPRARRTDPSPRGPPLGATFPGCWLLIAPSPPEQLAGRGPVCLLFTLKLQVELLRQVSLSQRSGAVREVAGFPLEAALSRIKQTGTERRRQGFWLLTAFLPSHRLLPLRPGTPGSLPLTLLRQLCWSGTHLWAYQGARRLTLSSQSACPYT